MIERFPEIMQLPDEDKLTLIAELGQEILDENAVENPALIALIDQRLEDYQGHPERVSSWEEVRGRILASRE